MSVLDTQAATADNPFGWQDGTPILVGEATQWECVEVNDSSYVETDGLPCVFSVRCDPHTPPANHERHRIRAIANLQTFDDVTVKIGTAIPVEFGGTNAWFTPVSSAGSFTDVQGGWQQQAGLQLGYAGALTFIPVVDDQNDAGHRVDYLAIDVDCRARPDYSPEVRDAAGVDQSAGTVTDTNIARLYFGSVAYDGLPSLDWSVQIGDWSTSGSGVPPLSVLSPELGNGSYSAVFTVRSTIRGASAFPHEETITFDVDYNPAAVPSPPGSLTVEYDGDDIEVCWSDPGGVPWDDGRAIAEVWRYTCYEPDGVHVATIDDALTGCYTDTDPPLSQIDTDACEHDGPCSITYSVRYWGTISSEIEVPALVPDGMIIGWPSTAVSIPSGWSRVAALDAKFPRGSTATVSGATGGTTTHTHTTGGHTHTLPAHSHPLGGSTGSSNTSITTASQAGFSQTRSDQPHSHTRPANTNSGAWGAGVTGSASPAGDSDPNLPAYRDVIWIESDGTPVAFPIGSLAYSVEPVAGWEDDTASDARFLRGANTGVDGGGTGGSATHGHAIAAHTHTTPSHTHTSASSGTNGPQDSLDPGFGSTAPEWVPRHNHPISVSSGGSGNTGSTAGGNSGSSTLEPLHRRLNVLANVIGGLQVRLIGLFRGDASALPFGLTRCDGTDGTPDMRGWFARHLGSDNLGSTGGAADHAHTTPTHAHATSHNHGVTIGATPATEYERATIGGTQQDVPTEGHTHSSGGSTTAATPSSGSVGSGATDTVDHTPPFEDVHFVRIDGIATSPVDVPTVYVTSYSSASIDATTAEQGMESLAGLMLCTDKTFARPRTSVSNVPLEGGLPSVYTSISGTDVTLTISVAGRASLAALEAALKEQLVYFQPWRGQPGWYAPGPYTVQPAAPGVKVVNVTMTRQDPTAPVDPSTLL